MKKFTLFLCAVFLTMVGYSQGHETFDNFDSPGSSYEMGTFTGQDGSDWQYLKARGDDAAEIDDGDQALMLGRNQSPNAQLTSGTIQNGVGTLSFTYMQAFGSDVNLEVYVNDDLVYTATSDDQMGEPISTDEIFVDFDGDFTLGFFNPDDAGQVNIDDIIWTAYSDDGGTFPSPYCDIADADGVTVEGITAVDFAGTSISNDDTDSVLIDKTETVVNVTAGETYTFEVEGNTMGNFENDIVAFIDWNQNEVLDDDGEIFEVGTLENSTGDDGTSVSMEITVPEDAALGITRIRITKTYTDELGDGGAPPSPALINPCAIEFDAFGMGANPGFGQALDFTLNIEESNGGDDDEDCDQGDDSNDFFGGLQIGTGVDFENADDFLVSAGNTLNIQTISLNILAVEPIDQIEFIFYDDDNGAPGDVLPQSVTNSPDAEHQVHIGVAFGYNVYQVYVDVDLDFEGGADGASYWMQPVGGAAGGVDGGVFWEITSEGSLGEPIHGREAGGPWIADEDGSQGVFKLYCEQTDPLEPPILSCDFEILLSVEPITRVVFSNIDNTSDATIDGSPGLEDFTDIEGYVEQGTSYDIALEGNTNGDYNSYFTVFIDYSGEDQGEFSDFDMFEIGSITGSDGMDGQQATGTITLDENVPDGSYTMRIIKTYGVDATESPTNPCGIYSWGQAEDYTLVVGELSVENHDFENFTFYPNPVQNQLVLKAGEQIESVTVYNLLGQEVINVKPNTLQTQVNVDHLQAGVYLMNVTLNGTQKTFRVIKK